MFFGRHAFAILCFVAFVSLPAIGASLHVKTISQEGFKAKYDLQNAHRPGICIDIIHAIERVDPDIKFVGLEYNASILRIENMLNQGMIDAFFGHIKTINREKKFIFGPQLYSSNQALAVRRDDPIQVSSWSDVRKLGADGAILAITASGQVDYLRSIGGLIIDDQARSVPANLKKLISNRGRFYFGSENTLLEAIRQEGLDGELKILAWIPRKENYYVTFSKQSDPEIIRKINAALKKLEDTGELKKIRNKYLSTR